MGRIQNDKEEPGEKAEDESDHELLPHATDTQPQHAPSGNEHDTTGFLEEPETAISPLEEENVKEDSGENTVHGWIEVVRSYMSDFYQISRNEFDNMATAYGTSEHFLSGIYKSSIEESMRLWTRVSETCNNIITESIPAGPYLRKAYHKSKAKTTKLLDEVVRAYHTSERSKNVRSNFRTLFRTDPSFSMESFYGIAAVAMIVFVLKWIQQKLFARRRKVQFGNDVGDDRLGDSEGMKILRSTRDRSSTYDFYGMHLNQARSRSTSFEDLSRGSRGRSSSAESFGPPQVIRERVGSMDIFYSKAKSEMSKPRLATQTSVSTTSPRATLAPQEYVRSQLIAEENEEEGFLYDEFGLVTLSFEVIHYGPTKKSLTYAALVPPQTFGEASRHIMLRENSVRLKRNILLDVSEANVVVQEPRGKGDYQLAAKSVSLHVIHPAAGGGMNLYVKGSPKVEWREFTFESAHAAAQFQLDLLAYQVVGKTLRNIFEVLCIVHRGSIASDGQECVLHQCQLTEEKEEKEDSEAPKPIGGCAAWDDAMRALSSIPTIRIALERLWLSYRRPARVSFKSKHKQKAMADREVDARGYIKDEYLNQRLLLGPVDFFRLFVPALPETAIPQIDSNMLRMEQLLSWRKRAARAAVLVRAYANSHCLVNQGWNLYEGPAEDEAAITRRLSYDDNDENNKRDLNAKNEYYEASVSRDVLCHVRPFDFFNNEIAPNADSSSERALVLSPYQAYSLVGMHVFELPQGQGCSDHPVTIDRDPVDVFPSLAEMISGHPDLDFFVMSFFNKPRRCISTCYVRSLPKGIDPQFDKVMERFVQGSKEVRDRKVQLMLQLGQRSNLSFSGWVALRALALHLKFNRGRGSPLGLEATKDRYTLPSIRMSDYGETHHFGGALQNNSDLPKNYVSMTASFASSSISHILFSFFEERLKVRAVDLTFVLEGEQDDELPERALCTTRVVNVDTQSVAQVPSPKDVKEQTKESADANAGTSFSRWAKHSLDHAIAFFSTTGASASENDVHDLRRNPSVGSRLPQIQSDDPWEKATNDLIDVLLDLDIPIARGKNNEHRTVENMRSPDDGENHEEMTTIPVLSYFNRWDITQFLRATEGDVKKAALRMVETAAWRGRTFPIDTRSCRIELKNGQFFHQGSDCRGNPVFYLRNLCLGPWREDADATLDAMLHRLDTTLSKASLEKPDSKMTLIILMGRPVEQGEFDDIVEEESDEEVVESNDEESGDEAEDAEVESAEEAEDIDDANDAEDSGEESPAYDFNPRVPPSETWQLHTNKSVLKRFFDIIATHYPGRLGALLVVTGKGRNFYYATKIRRNAAFRKLIHSNIIRRKLRFADTFAELATYVDRRELVTIVGGAIPIEKSAYEC